MSSSSQTLPSYNIFDSYLMLEKPAHIREYNNGTTDKYPTFLNDVKIALYSKVRQYLRYP